MGPKFRVMNTLGPNWDQNAYDFNFGTKILNDKHFGTKMLIISILGQKNKKIWQKFIDQNFYANSKIPSLTQSKK